jgi:hypothetical protein
MDSRKSPLRKKPDWNTDWNETGRMSPHKPGRERRERLHTTGETDRATRLKKPDPKNRFKKPDRKSLIKNIH